MNSFGRLFRISIYGESHGEGVGIIIDGMKPGVLFRKEIMDEMLARRKPLFLGTTRKEDDEYEIISGLFKGYTTGSPINVYFKNKDGIDNYDQFKQVPRPGHADYTANVKYHGFQDYRGGGHFSGRLTTGIVAAGYFAREIVPFVVSSRIVISREIEENDSIGGIVELTVKNVNPGLGEPFFDSVESILSHLLFSIPAVKGVDFGIGFRGANMLGSEFNDCFISKDGKTLTNNNGGINGGISNGNDITIRVMVKPTPSISKEQETFDFKDNTMTKLSIQGRHDGAIINRIPVVLESAVYIGLADLMGCAK